MKWKKIGEGKHAAQGNHLYFQADSRRFGWSLSYREEDDQPLKICGIYATFKECKDLAEVKNAT